MNIFNCLVLICVGALAVADDSFFDGDELDPVEFGQLFRSTFIPSGPSVSGAKRGDGGPPVKKEFYVLNLEYSLLLSTSEEEQQPLYKRGRVSYRTSSAAAGPLGLVAANSPSQHQHQQHTGGQQPQSAAAATVRQAPLEAADIERLLAAAARGGVYRLHVSLASSAGDSSASDAYPRQPPGASLVASVPACELVAAGLSDQLTLHVDQTHGGVVAVDYEAVGAPSAARAAVPLVSRDCSSSFGGAPRVAELLRSAPLHWNTTVVLSFGVEAPRPIARPPAPAADKEKEKNESFFSKYFWWIVGGSVILLFNLLASDTQEQNPERAAGSRRRQ